MPRKAPHIREIREIRERKKLMVTQIAQITQIFMLLAAAWGVGIAVRGAEGYKKEAEP